MGCCNAHVRFRGQSGHRPPYLIGFENWRRPQPHCGANVRRDFIREYFSPNWRSSRSVKAQFIGTWKLVSWKIEQADGEVTDSPLGPNPLGWIMYQPGGRMCVAVMRSDRPRFASNNLMEATPEEIKIGFEGYYSYCGSYEVNERERFIIHHL